MSKVTIQKSQFELPNGRKGVIAIFMYVGEEDPVIMLDNAVSTYTEYESYHEFIDNDMNNPSIRVIVSEINAMDQREFDRQNDRLKTDRE